MVSVNFIYMIYKDLKTYIALLFISTVNVVFSQVEVKIVYPDGRPNNNCYVQLDTTNVGFTNKNGIVLIDDKNRGELYTIEDLETGYRVRFRLKMDTLITTEKMQVFDQVDVKPVNRKKLSKEILEINKSRLPKELNLKGQFFYSELYIIDNLKDESESDTLVETFLCNIVILDIFGDQSILINSPRKIIKGKIENQEYFEIIESIIKPGKNFKNSIVESINYENFKVKGYRKFNSELNYFNKHMDLKFFFKNKGTIGGISNGKEIKYNWDKSDSTLIILSKYYQQGVKSNEKFSAPFAFTEFSNKNKNYTDSYVVSEIESRFFNESINTNSTNSLFMYFYIDEQIKDKPNLNGYKKIESMQDFLQNVKVNKSHEPITPILFPLRFPEAIFLGN